MIHQNRQLSLAQLDDLMQLREACHIADGNRIPVYPDLLMSQRRHMANFLYLEQGKMLGFLAVFFFHQNAAEISLLVDPKSRQKGIGRALLKASLPLLLQESLSFVYFTRPKDLPLWPDLSAALDYASSEYHLSLTNAKPFAANTQLLIRQANESDLPALCFIENQCFGEDIENELQIKNLLRSEDHVILVGELDGLMLAKVHLAVRADALVLSNLAVLLTAQNQGYGRAMIEASIVLKEALKKDKLSLDVAYNNAKAVQLYLHCGFEIENACDYFIIDILKLKAYCELKHGSS